MNDNEYASFEERAYVNPTLSRDEQLSFVDTLRETMGRNTAQINADTYALGSQLPSNLGGLSGAEDTFVARYQTPQLNQTAADLRTAAQQTALNQALTNLQDAYAKRYNDAIQAYQKQASSSSGSNSNTGGNTTSDTLNINTNSGESNDLAVRLNEAVQNEFNSTNQEQFNEVMENVNKLQQSGQYQSQNSVGFSYGPDGQTQYGIIYRDVFGNITGVSTPTAEYQGQNAINWLRQQAATGNLKNSAGQTMTDFNVLFVS